MSSRVGRQCNDRGVLLLRWERAEPDHRACLPVFDVSAAGGTLMGLLGALLALPVAATVMMVIEELRVELPGEQE
jgi:hypothetical protein